MSESRPLLSIGMIFKNEIRCLERCLKSLQSLREAVPCELVMADTGSDDGSREVAERYADTLIDFPWVDDFAAARNAVLDRCSGTWYLTVDCDEWMEDVQPLVDFLRQPEEEKRDFVLITQFNYLDMSDKTMYSAAAVGRMARLRGGLLRYEGKIHETLGYQEILPLWQNRLDIVLYHDGYAFEGDEASKKAKSERNMALLREELRAHPYDLRRLVQCIQSAYDKDEEMKYAKRAMRIVGDRRARGNDMLPL